MLLQNKIHPLRRQASSLLLPRLLSEKLAQFESAVNLYIRPEAIASKTVGFYVRKGKDGEDGLTAESVEIHDETRVVKARRQIVSVCGELGSPKVLLLSGIGSQEHLKYRSHLPHSVRRRQSTPSANVFPPPTIPNTLNNLTDRFIQISGYTTSPSFFNEVSVYECAVPSKLLYYSTLVFEQASVAPARRALP
ncbi:hypothetical protein R3P38DRAFT_1796625 [Favolaschia claudopus]|uniref:Glucose-methanol-choline oxidoreductase N-terminal domain-containing protein n=1 Tax=Favolaschia claudopus TaxID=2862362 RepID=A0AAW0A6P0_9AGAR